MLDDDISTVELRGVPEPGQLVECRRAQWIVSEVDACHLERGGSQNLVRMSSIDEDSLGREIEVVWEIEPGAKIVERAGLPEITGQDDGEALRSFLDAVRWGAATNADRGHLQAPFRSGVSIEDYQLDPLVRSIDMSRVNLLIADDVGLGKTIEAGLVVQEMMIRHRVRTVLVLCPASLQEKWQAEMDEKFGLDFQIIDTDYVKTLRRQQGLHANPWTSHPRLITSMDWAKQGEGLRLFKQVLPHHVGHPRRFDMLIIDEAHNVGPTVGKYSVENQRTRLVRLIAPHFQHKLFLTATPHDGYTESFTALLELLDDQRFSRSVLPDERELTQVMVRRLKNDLVDAYGKRIYPVRRLESLPVRLTDGERKIRKLLTRLIESREKKTEDDDRFGAQKFIHELLRKRLASSPRAFHITLEKYASSVSGERVPERRMKMDDRILRTKIARTREDYSDDELREDAELDAVEEASCRIRSFSSEEAAMLSELREWAREASRGADSKAMAIIDWIQETLMTDGDWNDERVILFTEYRATQVWLQEIMANRGLGGDRLGMIHGSMQQDERNSIRQAFQYDPKFSAVRILLATDAAAEGIDLQNHCSRMIHIEIPYNPNVMEQRNGRIDRHGQRASEIQILHPVDAGGELGDDILRAIRKLDAMRADMVTVNPVIAGQMSAVLEGQRKEIDDTQIRGQLEKSRRYVRAEKELNEKIRKLHDRLYETRTENGLEPHRIESAVRVALGLGRRPDLIPVDTGDPDERVFKMPELTGSWRVCLKGLEHPHTKAIRPVTFDHDLARGRDDLVLVHLNHPLVQMSLRLLRAQVWAQTDKKAMNRVCVAKLPGDVLEGPGVVVVSRFVLTGGSHHRLHEELTEAGGYLTENGFRRAERISDLRRWLAEGRYELIEHADFDELAHRFDRSEKSVLSAVDARSKDRLKSLDNILGRRCEREIRDITDILQNLKSSLQQELKKDAIPEQLEMEFSEEEKRQVRRDRRALEDRLARIDGEIELETQTIEARYASPSDHTFPVAVVFVVPEGWHRGVSA
jgi:superfamily II DNA/RNA helicase